MILILQGQGVEESCVDTWRCIEELRQPITASEAHLRGEPQLRFELVGCSDLRCEQSCEQRVLAVA